MTNTPAAGESSDEQQWFPVARRSVLRAAGASAVLLGMGAGTTVAQSDEDGQEGTPQDDGDSDDDSQMDGLDPIFGLASAGPNPCMGDASEDCFESFDVQPAHEVEMHIDLPEELFPFTAPGVLDDETIESINAAVTDGMVDTDELDDPELEVTAQTPAGEEVTLTVEEIATALAETTAFHFQPAGLAVEPGDVVLFSAETPDHAFAAYHPRHGRQNLVPDGVGPISSPLVPVGGYWLYQFETEGVYDAYCPPHEPFGMVMRVVVGDGTESTDDGDDEMDEESTTTADGGEETNATTTASSDETTTPTESGDETDGQMDGEAMEDTGRPPTEENNLASILGGLDPNVPSAAAALDSAALDPQTIVDEGSVSWDDVVSDHRGGGDDEDDEDESA
ncbi:plastocyanin/azurin family copper-binding protein [Haloferax profundi]|uniref:plastocyanin/azurin family copper-binding protein n=1 Tax=Haloferax profundi TaxID=1544718 RepID=UPI0012FC7E26|nr:plastocyanin/azurin family copper-binding protein [Haloferax profundi]